MNTQTYKATFRKKDDGLAINSCKGTAKTLPSLIAFETRDLFNGDLAPDGFTIEVAPVER